MKTDIAALIRAALTRIRTRDVATFDLPANVAVTRTVDSQHGDLTTNVAMTLSKSAEVSSLELAQLIIDHLPESTLLARAEVAGSGFINFYLAHDATQSVVAEILQAKENYGRVDTTRGRTINVEFFSVVLTDPLHVDHGRQAAYGESMAALLEAVGYEVHRAIYIDAGGLKNIENDLNDLGVHLDKAMEDAPDWLKLHPVQPVVLFRNGENVKMSTLSGGPVTLRELRDEVGNDAARFFYVMQPQDQILNFDLDLATSSREENPLFYVQYAHVRALRVFRHPKYKLMPWNRDNGHKNLGKLNSEKAQALLWQLLHYPEVIQLAAKNLAPHLVANFLHELTTRFHKFYNADRVLCDDNDLRDARLSLVKATAQVIQNGLALLGVSAPIKM